MFVLCTCLSNVVYRCTHRHTHTHISPIAGLCLFMWGGCLQRTPPVSYPNVYIECFCVYTCRKCSLMSHTCLADLSSCCQFTVCQELNFMEHNKD